MACKNEIPGIRMNIFENAVRNFYTSGACLELICSMCLENRYMTGWQVLHFASFVAGMTGQQMIRDDISVNGKVPEETMRQIGESAQEWFRNVSGALAEQMHA